jgi:hypothetical protein
MPSLVERGKVAAKHSPVIFLSIYFIPQSALAIESDNIWRIGTVRSADHVPAICAKGICQKASSIAISKTEESLI